MTVVERNHVVVGGREDGRPMVFAHGFGCDQAMWRHVAPSFEERFRTVLYDHVGFGGSDVGAFDPERHGSLYVYADALPEIYTALDLRDAVFVGHSVASMMGVLAAVAEPERFAALVLVCPSPCY